MTHSIDTKSVFHKESGYSLLELLYVVSIIAILLGMLVPILLTQKNRIIMAAATRKLRNIGRVMTDYSLSDQHMGNYANFQELKDAQMIENEITVSNLITDYSLVFMTSDSARGSVSDSGFTVIAYPRRERFYGYLSTFAITEDNVVRVYRGRPGEDPNDPHTWPPAL
jgi:prepilin-type N-terminal cleavage/methylation domain-containing protein